MKYSVITTLLIFGVIFTGCGESTSQNETEATPTQENKVTFYKTHHQGESCAHCHSISDFNNAPQRSDDGIDDTFSSILSFFSDDDTDKRFTSGVTLYDTLNSTQATQAYSVQLLLTGGEIQKYEAGKGSGNFNGTFNDGIDTYTTQIVDIKGKVVRSSLTDSHNATRFDCNRCHTASGANGAAGRVFAKSTATVATNPPTTNTSTTTTTTTTSTPTTTTSTSTHITTMKFAANVLPILRNKCASCHGSSGRFSITHSTSAYAGVVPFINTSSPTSSRLLLKASGSVGHGGGRVFSTTSSSYSTILNWINAGGLNN